MYEINLTVTGQNLTVEKICSVNGTVDIIKCNFAFDDWAEFPARQAIFKNSGAINSYVAPIVEDSCVIPWEALKREGAVRVALVGTNTDGQVQRTNTVICVIQTATLQGGVNSIEPTADQYAQFIAEVEEIIGQAGVMSVNGQTGDVTLTASDVGALADTTVIPTRTSQLTNDSGYITSAPVSSVNGQTGNVVLNIPTNTSDLTNDSGFLTSAVTSFNGQSGAVTYTPPVTQVNGQTGNVTINVPTRVGQLINDVGYLASVPSEYVTDTELQTAISGKANTADLASVATSGSYNDLTNKPTIPVLPSNIVNTINGQTGTVVISTATTSADGLMSSQDKTKLEAVYADYSSALSALGV